MLLLFVALLIGYPLYSQDTTNLSIKGGFNISTIGGDSFGVRPKIGINAGIKSIILISEHFSITPELMVSEQGAYTVNSYRLTHLYINMPILARYENGVFFVNTGIQPSSLIFAKSKNTTTKENKINTSKLFYPDHFSITIGMGIFINKYLEVEARYNHDMGDYNRVLQFSISYKLL